MKIPESFKDHYISGTMLLVDNKVYSYRWSAVPEKPVLRHHGLNTRYYPPHSIGGDSIVLRDFSCRYDPDAVNDMLCTIGFHPDGINPSGPTSCGREVDDYAYQDHVWTWSKIPYKDSTASAYMPRSGDETW